MAVLKRTRMRQDGTFPTGWCDCTPGFTTSSNLFAHNPASLVGYPQRGRADAYPNPNPNPPKGYARPRLFCHLKPIPSPYRTRRRPLRPQRRLCLAAKTALQPWAALHEAEAVQTCACAQARAASLNDQVTAMRGRQSCLAPWMRVSTGGRSPHRRVLRPRRPAAAAARFVGPHGRAL